MVWEDGENIWTMYFTENPGAVYDSNTMVSDTNSGGYIVTTRRSGESLISVVDGAAKTRKDMRIRLYAMNCANMAAGAEDEQAE